MINTQTNRDKRYTYKPSPKTLLLPITHRTEFFTVQYIITIGSSFFIENYSITNHLLNSSLSCPDNERLRTFLY